MITIIDLGLVDYKKAYEIQKELVARRKLDEMGDSLILAEHKDVFTIGRTGRRENLLVDERFLEEKRVEVLSVDRGGDITFHGPGQLVLYPIIDLKVRGKDLHKYLRDLEEVVIRFLGKYSVAAERRTGRTGVWVDGKKIASIGVASSNWVTYHGVSVNLNTDLRFFSMIVPCGMKDVEVTSLNEISKKAIDMEKAKRLIVSEFKKIFNTPSWLRKRLVHNEGSFESKAILSGSKINTVCESALCPNLNECFSRKRATFLILGNRCTRSCAFCNCRAGSRLRQGFGGQVNLPYNLAKEAVLDPAEPQKIAFAVKKLGLKYVVITSVTRDDLEDGGAEQFVRVIEAIRESCNRRAGSRLRQGFGGQVNLPYDFQVTIEVLVPDFRGERLPIEKILRAEPDVFGHNVEMAERLYPFVRPGADYNRSLQVLRIAKDSWRRADSRLRQGFGGQVNLPYGSPAPLTKSGIMVGLGETEEEILGTIKDIRTTGCDILTIGQYLRPSEANIAVRRFVTPEEFSRYKKIGDDLGFRHVASGPFVRSSYLAEEIYNDSHCEEGEKGAYPDEAISKSGITSLRS